MFILVCTSKIFFVDVLYGVHPRKGLSLNPAILLLLLSIHFVDFKVQFTNNKPV